MIRETILQQELVYHTCKNGLKLIILPSSEADQMALYVTKYGSIHSNYTVNGQTFNDPKGVAHFLEHLMFNKADGDSFTKFTKLGANSNAYTSFNHTAYLFKAVDNFLPNLAILLSMVQTPYFPTAHIKKEIGIIEQEIEMYNDMDE